MFNANWIVFSALTDGYWTNKSMDVRFLLFIVNCTAMAEVTHFRKNVNSSDKVNSADFNRTYNYFHFLLSFVVGICLSVRFRSSAMHSRYKSSNETIWQLLCVPHTRRARFFIVHLFGSTESTESFITSMACGLRPKTYERQVIVVLT